MYIKSYVKKYFGIKSKNIILFFEKRHIYKNIINKTIKINLTKVLPSKKTFILYKILKSFIYFAK